MATLTSPHLLKIGSYLKLIRVHQWVKNLFLFIPAFFAGQLLEPNKIMKLVLAFLVYSIVASCVYILNDYMDIEKDKLHPTKRNRPLASGAISKSAAIVLGILLLTIGLTGAWLFNAYVFAVVLGYFLMNVAYSIRLKHVAILDIFIISLGFLFRIYAGGLAIDVPISKWLVLLTFLLAMVLALAKRRDEFLLYQEGKKTRRSISEYNLPFINSSIAIMSAVTVVSYIMYTVSPDVVDRLGNENVFLTTILVVLGIMRYLQLTLVFERSGSPTKILLTDRFLQIIIAAWVVSYIGILYAPALFGN